MPKGIKIVIIGGGSSYTPELMEGFINRYHELPISELWLVDIEEGKEKVEIISELSKRMWKKAGYDVKIISTLNRKEALKDADFVTTQFRVGLLNARIKDERIPSLHGMLGQETNGAGGIFKAFRTIPVMKEIVEDMKEVCPNAWLINFTNPSGIITEAVIKHFGWEKCIGLCNVPVIAMMSEYQKTNYKQDELEYRFVGLNHFHWHKVYTKTGKEITREIIEHINEPGGGTPANIFSAPFNLEQLNKMNLLPCGYHRYYYNHKDMLAHSLKEFRCGGTRAEQMKDVEKELFEIYKDPNLDTKPELLSKRGGAYYSEAACECISAIYNDKNLHMVVSTVNNGCISCLDNDSIVEVSCIISKDGAKTLSIGKLASAQKGWLQMMKAMEECVIDAAIHGDYGQAIEAFMLNPMVENGEDAIKVLHELMIAHEKYLPQFKDKIIELKNEGITIDDAVVQSLM